MWGLSFLFIEIGLREIPPLWLVSARTMVGAVVLFTLLTLRGQRMPTDGDTWRHMLLLGTINNAAPWAAIIWAQQFLPSGLVALLCAVIPVSTLAISAAVGLERITRRRLGGLLLAMSGVAVIAAADLDDLGRTVAILVTVVSTLLYAISAVYAKRTVSGRVPAMQLATGQVACAAAVSFTVALLAGGPAPSVTALEPVTLGAVLALGSLGTGLAFAAFYALIDRVGATNTTMTQYVIPLVAIAAGAVLLDERIGWSAAAGGAMIAAGIWLSQRSGRR